MLPLALLAACTEADPAEDTAGGGETDLGVGVPACIDHGTPVAATDDQLGFDANALAAAFAAVHVTSVTWSTGAPATEPLRVVCDDVPLEPRIVTREGTGDVDPESCPPGPELFANVTCTLDLGDGSLTADAQAALGAAQLDAITVGVVNDGAIAIDPARAASVGDPTDLQFVALGPAESAQVSILGTTSSGRSVLWDGVWAVTP